jgi:hypothetical protein
MRVLSNDDMEQVLSAAECMAALESAYRELAAGQGANRPRNHTYFPVEDHQHPGFRFRFKSQEGGSASSGCGRCGSPRTWSAWRPCPAGSSAAGCCRLPRAAGTSA